MEFINSEHIKFNKKISELDKFVIDFLEIIIKHTNYVLISGYVSILFGRSRGTEDVDIIIPKLSFENFLVIHNNLINYGYWSLNSDNSRTIYELLNTNSIRYAKKNNVIPNMEIKTEKNKLDRIALHNKIKIEFANKIVYISPIELQIAFKELLLSSSKDIEDALHLREIFKDKLDLNKLNTYINDCEDEKKRIC
jgi:hypothetical protein